MQDVELEAGNHQVERNVALMKTNSQQCELLFVSEDEWKLPSDRNKRLKLILSKAITLLLFMHMFDMQRLYKNSSVV